MLLSRVRVAARAARYYSRRSVSSSSVSANTMDDDDHEQQQKEKKQKNRNIRIKAVDKFMKPDSRWVVKERRANALLRQADGSRDQGGAARGRQ